MRRWDPRKRLSDLPATAPLTLPLAQQGYTDQQWANWTRSVLEGTLRWFTASVTGILALLPLVVAAGILTIQDGWTESPLLLVPVAYAAVPAGAGAYAGRGVVRNGTGRERASLAGALAVLLVAGALAAAAVVLASGAALVLGALAAALWLVGKLWGTGIAGPVAHAGEVWLVKVPNDNRSESETHKVRPAVVLEGGNRRVLVAWSTSQEKRSGQRGYLEVTDLDGWPRQRGKRSFLKVGEPLRAGRDDLVSKRGTLPPASLRAVQRAHSAHSRW